MKRLLLIAALAFAACENGDKTILPVEYEDYCAVTIAVENSNGDNLFDLFFDDHILKNDIYIDYNDEIFPLYNALKPTRDVGPPPFEFTYNFYDKLLQLGWFYSNRGFHGESFTINWGDGTSDEVKFDLYVTWEGKEYYSKPTIYKKIWLNGELQSYTQLTVEIVK